MRGKIGVVCIFIIFFVWGFIGFYFYVGFDKSGYYFGEELVLRICNIGLMLILFGEGYYFYCLENGMLVLVRIGFIFFVVFYWFMFF